MARFADVLRDSPSQRDPAYRPMMTLGEEERAALAERIGAPANYSPDMLRRMVAADPSNIELRKALVSTIMSAEFAGVDAFSRKVVEWQDWPVPSTLIMAMARQTWDEVRHAQLAKGVLESYGGEVGEYPDSLAGGGGGPQARAMQAQMLGDDPADPLISLSTTNVSLEGAALALFESMSHLGRQIGDHLLDHCYDYNWADEVTHTAIGDYFVKQLCEGNPENERRALAVHARHERMRAGLTGEQSEEIRAFFAEEDDRGAMALGAGERTY
jgi:uncharacterized ferritin-like protein (DUF455 family)